MPKVPDKMSVHIPQITVRCSTQSYRTKSL